MYCHICAVRRSNAGEVVGSEDSLQMMFFGVADISTNLGNHKKQDFSMSRRVNIRIDQWEIDKNICSELMARTVLKMMFESGPPDPRKPEIGIFPVSLWDPKTGYIGSRVQTTIQQRKTASLWAAQRQLRGGHEISDVAMHFFRFFVEHCRIDLFLGSFNCHGRMTKQNNDSIFG